MRRALRARPGVPWTKPQGYGGAAVGVGRRIAAVAFKVAIQAGPADPENLGGADTVAVAHAQNFLDVDFANFVQRQRLPFVVTGQALHSVL